MLDIGSVWPFKVLARDKSSCGKGVIGISYHAQGRAYRTPHFELLVLRGCDDIVSQGAKLNNALLHQ